MREDTEKQEIESILNEKPQLQKSKKHRGRPKRVQVEGQEPESTKQTITDPLIEPFYVQMDNHGFSVFEVIQPIDKESKPYEQSIGHYSNFDSCLSSIVKKKINSKSYSSIREYIEQYKKLIELFFQVTNVEFKRK